MANPWFTQLGPLSPLTTNGIATAQAPAQATNLTLSGSLVSGGVATLDNPRRVAITTTSNETARTFTIYGTNRTKQNISEAIKGTNGSAVYTSNDFKTVTQISVDAATSGNVEAGTNGVASTPWFNADYHTTPLNLGVSVVVSGTITYNVEYTYEDLNNPVNGVFPALWVNAIMSNKTTNLDATNTFSFPVTALRLTQTTNTTSSYATITVLQAGLGFGN
ncbi:MAG TPA: VCBS domain-containing protein [Bryobacteraceae bacterium]|nr:VCBS domain-containing protein [Bryobacteraceae bacterium]